MSTTASRDKGKARDASHLNCQRCNQPILLDPAIANLSPSTFSLITSALPSTSSQSALSPADKLAALPPASQPGARIWAAANGFASRHQAHHNVAESFVLLSDSVMHPTPSLSAGPSSGQNPSPALAANLHAILSSRTPISHPLCTECTAMLQSELQRELEELTRERDAYLAFEKGIAKNRDSLRSRRRAESETLGEHDLEGTEEEWQALHRRKRELDGEEEALKKVLVEKEKQLAKMRQEEERVKLEEEEMKREEDAFLLRHSALHSERKALVNKLHSARTHLLLSQRLLHHLETTNVYNDAFQIGHVPDASGKNGLTVGTINGLRLGGRPMADWDEINAAWGLVALCIDRIAVKVGCTFERYKIMPLASFSRIEELPPNKAVYELYASSDLSPARLLQNRRFNYGLVALLDVLKQLVDFGRHHDRGWGVGNIEIRKDRINGHSIRLPGISAMQMPALPSMSIMGLGATLSTETNDGSGDEQWTKACRGVLAVLKRILVVESEADRAGRA
ncbi:autophagy protein Apg6-domain-containing protein [Kockovaella imperatae]|uniref:Autophagy protein Apg6-domain-containing protein n=1 Tax=Kockovaella imperatae TaxID=4999 RepID=A0A1Y1UDA0_9TREE|nr:autophagy protein Apg6-domain-containing protein [Kockovaella imperatae]ORX36010.1 autophagy protein Apg6-domain-containing protein [Kockovaella imperatae]